MLFGDLVAEVTKKIGVKPCIPCQARQQKMNQAHLSIKEKLSSLLNGQSGSSGSQQPPT